MASYLGVRGVLLALEAHLKRRLPVGWRQGAANPTMTPPPQVEVLGSTALADTLNNNLLGLYLYRITPDPHGRNRPLTVPATGGAVVHAELPVNLQVLVIANGTSVQNELDLMAWAMIELANHAHLDVAGIADDDPDWGRAEAISVVPVEMTNEDLMRLWDQFDARYTLAVPYELRTVRLRLRPADSEGPEVATRAFPLGSLDGGR